MSWEPPLIRGGGAKASRSALPNRFCAVAASLAVYGGRREGEPRRGLCCSGRAAACVLADGQLSRSVGGGPEPTGTAACPQAMGPELLRERGTQLSAMAIRVGYGAGCDTGPRCGVHCRWDLVNGCRRRMSSQPFCSGAQMSACSHIWDFSGIKLAPSRPPRLYGEGCHGISALAVSMPERKCGTDLQVSDSQPLGSSGVTNRTPNARDLAPTTHRTTGVGSADRRICADGR